MANLIDRQAAIELVRDVCDAIMSGCDSYYDPEMGDEVYNDIREVDAILKCNKEIRIALANLPSAQPERKKGEWVLQSDDYHEYYECDQCGIAVGLDDVRNFCCNCGADMRGDQE